MDTLHQAHYHSPIGWLHIIADDASIRAIRFQEAPLPDGSAKHPLLMECIRQLEEYFQGRRREFSLPVAPEGTEFHRRVWRRLQEIPYGKTVSYRDIAAALGDPKAVRAVGNANGKNPIPIIIPCHRVIGANGKLVGYGGGVWRKEWLLRHEGALM